MLLETITLLQAVSNSLTEAINNAAIDGTLRKDQLSLMKDKIDKELDFFGTSYSSIVNRSAENGAKLILDRNGQIFLEIEGTQKLLDTLEETVLLEIMQAKGRDGLILSDRVWRITQESKAFITNRIQQGILLGETHTRVANDIRQYVIGTGGMNYKAKRLVLTEFARAYKVANEMSVQQMRENSDFMWYEKWELSPAHKGSDACDILAKNDPIGQGEGVYETAPNRHPGCFCYIYPVFREKKTKKVFENVSGVLPNTENVTKSDKSLAKDLQQ